MTAAMRGPAAVTISATVESAQHALRVTAADSGDWVTGIYSYNVRVSKGAEVFEVESGTLEILPDLNAQVAGVDGRTHAARVLDAIEAVIEKRATLDQERYSINNRELARTPIADLLKLRDVYRSEVARERHLARGGKLFGRSVRVIL